MSTHPDFVPSPIRSTTVTSTTMFEGLPKISSGVQNSSIVSQGSDGSMRSTRTPLLGRASLDAAAAMSGGFSFSFRSGGAGVSGGLASGPLAPATDSPNRNGSIVETSFLPNASVVLGPSCAMSTSADRRSAGSGGGTPLSVAATKVPTAAGLNPQSKSSTSPIPPLEPTDILEVNKSLNRSFHATPVIESQNVDKKTLVHKRQKLLNDKYVLYPRQELGRGSYGKVVLCYSMDDGVYFAAKVFQRHHLKRVGLGADSALLRIHVELDILKRLRHDNIIALHEFIDDGCSPKLYMIFELAAYGEVLKMTQSGELAEGEEPLPEHEVQRVVGAVVSALAFAHERGVAHRDVKPENILITSTHAVKLADFGTAVADVAEGDVIHRGGSIAFLPPELIVKETVLSRATSNVGRLPRQRSSSFAAGWKSSLSLEGPQSLPRSHGLSSQPLLDHIDDDNSLIGSLHTPGTVSYRTDSSLGAQLRQISSLSATSSANWVAPNSGNHHFSSSGFELPSVRPTTDAGAHDAGPLSAESSMSLLHPSTEDTPSRIGAASVFGAPFIAGHLVDFFKADVWSLGITTFFLLFGKLPWSRAKDATSLADDITDHPDPFFEILNDSSCDSDNDDDTSHSNSPLPGTPTAKCSQELLEEEMECTSRGSLAATAVPRETSFAYSGQAAANLVESTPDNLSLPGISVQNSSWAGSMVTLERTNSKYADDPKYLAARKATAAHLLGQQTGSGSRRKTPRTVESLGVSAGCIDFIRQCLSADPQLRPTAAALEVHDWLTQRRQRRGTQQPIAEGDVHTFSVPPPLITSPRCADPITKHTDQIHVRDLDDEEQRDVPVDLQVLLKAKVGPSNKRLQPSFFDASPPPAQSAEPFSSSASWSSPGSQHISPVLSGGASHALAQRRSKDDSVIFTSFSATNSAPAVFRRSGADLNLNGGVVAAGAPHNGGDASPATPRRPPVHSVPAQVVRHADCVAIEASGATPYGQRSSRNPQAVWSGGFAQPSGSFSAGERGTRSPSSPSKNPIFQPLEASDSGGGRKITLRELLRTVEGPAESDMKHVSSGPL